MQTVGFRGPKSKKRHGGTMSDNTGVSGQRSNDKRRQKFGTGWAVPCGTVVPPWHGVTVLPSTAVPRSQFGSGLPGE